MNRLALTAALALTLTGGAAAAENAGHDFVAEARILYRDVACGGPDAPASAHCKTLLGLYAGYRHDWLTPASAFLKTLVPAGLPTQVVYPFGGGDLLSALATFPDATEITTISLEPAGDVRAATATAPAPAAELAHLRRDLGNLFAAAHSKTTRLDDEAHQKLPGQLVFALAALAIHGYEPTSLRYFQLAPDGAIAYLDDAALTAGGARAVRNAELRFRRAGDAAAPERTLRHIAFNLDDRHLDADPSLLRHLEAKGDITAMTKAASHLLWIDDFSKIRGYLLGHMRWMISDSTGIPPRHARAAGFIQEAHGVFDGPIRFGPINAKDGADVRALFTSRPAAAAAPLPFRSYGYPDRAHHGHIIVTRRP